METELKFALSPQARRRIDRYVVTRLSAGEALRHADRTTYYDTPDHALRRAGLSLRIRHRRNTHSFIQTVKAVGGGGSPFSRGEWEWPVESEQLAPERLGEVPALPPLAKEHLRPVFHTDIERTELVLRPSDGARLEVAIDEGNVSAPAASEPLSELEIELKEGSPEELFRVGLEFLNAAPLALQVESKADRGYRLHGIDPPGAREAGAVLFSPDISVGEAFCDVAQSVLAHLLANQPATLHGEEQEGTHQMRVAIRRLRSLIKMFEPFLQPQPLDQLVGEMKRLGAVLGEARDWDVLVGETLPRAIDDGVDAGRLRPLVSRAHECRHAARQAAKKAVLEPEFARFVLAFQTWLQGGQAVIAKRRLDRPLAEEASALLARLARTVNKRLAKSHEDAPETLHSVRKSAKKLRYGIEYLESLYGDDGRRYHKACHRLQKRLGVLNDLETAMRRTDQLMQPHRLDLVPAMAVLAHWSSSRRSDAMKKIAKSCAAFERARPFWN